LIETNITPWRRAIAGDLTSTLDFRNPDPGVVPLPDTSGDVPPDQSTPEAVKPDVPEAQDLPGQEPGVRRARAVPYEVSVRSDVNPFRGTVDLQFVNTGETAAVFQVRSLDG